MQTSPRQGLIFYGWWIVLVAFLGSFITGGSLIPFGLMFKPMSEDLGWNRTVLSGAFTLRIVMSFVMTPIAGVVMDRYGPRLIMTASAILGGLAFILIGTVQEVWQFYALYGVVGSLTGAGTGGFVANIAVAKWFVRRRGRALGVATTGSSAGAMVLVQVIRVVMDSYGWRWAWVVLGGLFWALLILPSALLLRRQPEDMGLLPDGDASSAHARASPSATKTPIKEDAVWTLGQALRTPNLWLLVTSFAFSTVALQAIMLHQIPFITDKGFSETLAASAISLYAGVSIVAKLVWGLFTERIHVRYLLMLNYLGSALAVTLLIWANSMVLILVYAFFYGATRGAWPTLNSIAWPDYFGRAFLGTIRGVTQPIAVASGALGPLFAGVVYDQTGSYSIAFFTFMASWFVATCFMFLARPPRHAGARGEAL